MRLLFLSNRLMQNNGKAKMQANVVKERIIRRLSGTGWPNCGRATVELKT